MWGYPLLEDLRTDMERAIDLAGGIAPLAAGAGVSERAVYAWKNGDRFPSRKNLAKVTEYLEKMLSSGGGSIVSGPEFPSFALSSQHAEEVSPGFSVHECRAPYGPPGRQRDSECSFPLNKKNSGGVSEAWKGGAPSAVVVPLLTEQGMEAGELFDAARLAALNVSPGRAAFFDVPGRGMEPLLHCGDRCLVRLDDTELADDGVYVLRSPGGIFVRRFCRMPAGRLFRCDNRDFAHKDFEPAEGGPVSFEVLGRVVWVGKQI